MPPRTSFRDLPHDVQNRIARSTSTEDLRTMRRADPTTKAMAKRHIAERLYAINTIKRTRRD